MSRLEITSLDNPQVRDLSRLHDRRHRDRRQQFLIEGRTEIERAFSAGVEIECLYVSEELWSSADAHLAERIIATGVNHQQLGEAAFKKVSYRQGGLLAVARTYELDLAQFSIRTDALLLVVEGVEKPGNLGAMLRSADAAGAAVIVCDPQLDVFNPNVIRASLGTLFTVPVSLAPALEVRTWLERWQVGPVVTMVGAAIPYWQVDLKKPSAVVVGAEHTGVSDAWRGVGQPVAIPMRGKADSLNAATAAAVVLFEAVRQREAG
jgi:RNA methyltransferase, TrmH family